MGTALKYLSVGRCITITADMRIFYRYVMEMIQWMMNLTL